MKQYETELSTANSMFKFIIFSPIIIAPFFWWLSKFALEDNIHRVIFTVIGTIAIWLYLAAKQFVLKKALANYIQCLKNKSFDEAIYYGRTYYGVKRNGLGGISGNNISASDEQRITNDINAIK